MCEQFIDEWLGVSASAPVVDEGYHVVHRQLEVFGDILTLDGVGAFEVAEGASMPGDALDIRCPAVLAYEEEVFCVAQLGKPNATEQNIRTEEQSSDEVHVVEGLAGGGVVGTEAHGVLRRIGDVDLAAHRDAVGILTDGAHGVVEEVRVNAIVAVHEIGVLAFDEVNAYIPCTAGVMAVSVQHFVTEGRVQLLQRVGYILLGSVIDEDDVKRTECLRVEVAHDTGYVWLGIVARDDDCDLWVHYVCVLAN